MTAVIRYRTLYLIDNCEYLLISFALGNDIFHRCVIGLPTLLVLDGLIDLVKGNFVYSEFNCTFQLTLDPLGKGLPKGVVFDNSTPTIIQGVSTNSKPDPSLLH